MHKLCQSLWPFSWTEAVIVFGDISCRIRGKNTDRGVRVGWACVQCTALHTTALHCTALHCTALHCTALHCPALHCTVGKSESSLHKHMSQRTRLRQTWIPFTIRCTFYSLHFSLYTIHYTVYSFHCSLYYIFLLHFTPNICQHVDVQVCLQKQHRFAVSTFLKYIYTFSFHLSQVRDFLNKFTYFYFYLSESQFAELPARV